MADGTGNSVEGAGDRLRCRECAPATDNSVEGAGESAPARLDLKGVLGRVAHQRCLGENAFGVHAWRPENHWGDCGTNCPCCRADCTTDWFGSCHVCEAVDDLARLRIIGDFLVERQCTKEVLATAVARLFPDRPNVVSCIRPFLPEIHGVASLAGVTGILAELIELEADGGCPCLCEESSDSE